MGHFGHTYLPMSDVFYTMPITLLIRFLLKLDVLYERSLREFKYVKMTFCEKLIVWLDADCRWQLDKHRTIGLNIL